MFKVVDAYTKEYFLNLHWNIYGQKQAGRVCNHYLTKILINKVGFKKSSVDNCVFYKGNLMYLLYTNGFILSVPHKDEVYKAVQGIQDEKLDITIEGDLQDFL